MAAVTFGRDRRATIGAAVAAAAGLGLLAFLGLRTPVRALHAYLAAYSFVVSTQVMALFLLMLGHAVGATWITIFRRLLEGIVATLPLAIPLFLPIALGLGHLYPWMHPEDATDPHLVHLLHHKHAWLNPTAFLVRAGLCLVLWNVFGALFLRWSLARDAGRLDPDLRRERALAAVGMPVVFLTASFAAFDWLMSLTPAWYSTAYGVYWATGGFTAALAVLVIVAQASQSRGLLEGMVRADHWHALGRLLFAAMVFWAYIGFFQYFLIYAADKPEEVTFYLAREGGWRAVSWLLALGHFALPFLVLLPREAKRNPRRLRAVAIWLLAMHAIDSWYLVLPVLSPRLLAIGAPEVGAFAGVGLAALAFGRLRVAGRAVVPQNDPALAAGLRYRSS